MEKGKQTYKLPKGWIEVEIEDISLKPAHTVKHICNSHKPTRNQKLQKSLPDCHRFFANPKNYFFRKQQCFD